MSTATQTPATDGGSATTTPGRLEEAIRQIVREEIQHPSNASASAETERAKPPTSALQPTAKDGFWLLIVVTNVALLLALVPDSVLTNSKLGLFMKLLPWLGSSLFVLGYAWFRDGILRLTRQGVFKVSMLVGLVILTPVSVSKFRIFHIKPLIEPSSADVLVDDEPALVGNDGRLNISLRSHKITVVEKAGEQGENAGQDKKPKTRDFQMSWREAFQAWRDSSNQPRWPLIYYVTVSDQKATDELRIEKTDGAFDPDFWRQPSPAYGGGELTKGSDPSVLVFPWNGGDVTLQLPYGNYKLISSRKNCAQTEVQTAQARPATVTVEFQKDLCQ